MDVDVGFNILIFMLTSICCFDIGVGFDLNVGLGLEFDANLVLVLILMLNFVSMFGFVVDVGVWFDV